MSREDDDKRAYRTSDDMVGRSIRRGTRKAIKVLTLGLIGGKNPVEELGKDAVEEIITKVIPRSLEDDD